MVLLVRRVPTRHSGRGPRRPGSGSAESASGGATARYCAPAHAPRRRVVPPRGGPGASRIRWSSQGSCRAGRRRQRPWPSGLGPASSRRPQHAAPAGPAAAATRSVRSAAVPQFASGLIALHLRGLRGEPGCPRLDHRQRPDGTGAVFHPSPVALPVEPALGAGRQRADVHRSRPRHRVARPSPRPPPCSPPRSDGSWAVADHQPAVRQRLPGRPGPDLVRRTPSTCTTPARRSRPSGTRARQRGRPRRVRRRRGPASRAAPTPSPAVSVNDDLAFTNNDSEIELLPDGSTTPTALTAGTHPHFSPDGSNRRLRPGGVTSGTIGADGTGETQVSSGPRPARRLRLVAGRDPVPALQHRFPGTPRRPPSTMGVHRGSPDHRRRHSVHVRGPTTVAWQAAGRSRVTRSCRVAGSNREGTAIAISKAGRSRTTRPTRSCWPTRCTSRTPCPGPRLAAEGARPDAAHPGGRRPAPIPAVMAEIQRALKPTAKQVYLLGGTGSNQRRHPDGPGGRRLHHHPLRGAVDRTDTSLKIAKFLGEGANAPEEIFPRDGDRLPRRPLRRSGGGLVLRLHQSARRRGCC